MAFDKFLIAPLKTGLQTNVKSWQIMDDAFEYLQNAYVFRGRVRKRFGSVLMGTTPLNSRLRILIGTTNGVTGNLMATNLPGGITQLKLGQIFSVGMVIFTVNVLADGNTNSTDSTITGTISVTANPNTFAITGNGTTNLATSVYYYPSTPVMGIGQYESGAINNHPTYAFDTQFAYLFSGGAWARSGAALWHGTNSNYFWIDNWQGQTGDPVLFVSNFNATVPVPAATDDPIWYTIDGSTWTAASGANAFYFLPNGGAIHTGAFVSTALIIIAFRNRLVLLNTIENDGSGAGGVTTHYVQRCRFSFNGSPFARNAWYEPNQSDSSGGVLFNNNIAAGGGYVDATTEEQIISAEFIKDRLIVYFERSTWELAYTGNEILPFIWNKLNTELGSQSTFSTIPFDKEIYTIGNSGVHACNGSNVIRIDDKIPDEIFTFKTENNETIRTVGIRNYYNETAIWTYVSDLNETTQLFPNQVLVYNYVNDSWATYDDCFTFFGYFEQQEDTTWANSDPITWEQSNETWISGVLQANQRNILGGTPEGFVLRLDDDVDRNAPSMYITAIAYAATGILTLTIINHNLAASPTEFPDDNDFIYLENIVDNFNNELFLNGSIFPVDSVIDSNTITINTFGGLTSGNYLGGGTAARVSNIQIFTKRYNPYVDQDTNVYLARIDFGVERTAYGAITVDYYASSAPVSMIQGGVDSGSIMGNSVLETFPYPAALYPLEQYQALLWHPVYFQSYGEFIQLILYFTPQQMIQPGIVFAPFVLEGMALYTQPVGRLQ